VGLIFTIFLGVGSFIFYQERMLFTDPAYITFEIIQTGWFSFEEHRYGAWVTQIFPLIGSKLGISLKSILILYSMSFYLFYLTIIYVSGHVLKQYAYALLFCLYLALMVSDVYFWPNNEIHQAVAWMTLFFSLWGWTSAKVSGSFGQEKQGPLPQTSESKVSEPLDFSKPKHTPLWMHGLLIGSLFFTIISHLLVIIPLGFLWIYTNIDFVRRYKKLDKKMIFYGILMLIGIGIRYWLSSDSSYDGYKLEGVKSISLKSLIDAPTNAQGISFLKLLLNRYWSLLIVASIGVYQLISTKQFLKLSFVFLTSMVFYLLVTLTFYVAITPSNLFYSESQWMVLSIVLAVPFVMDFLSRLNSNYALIVMILLFIFQVPKFYQGYQTFNNRLESLKSLTEIANQQSINKGYISETELDKNTFLLTWALPIETLLLSQIDDRFETLTIKNDGKIKQITTATDLLHMPYQLMKSEWLNQQYFILDGGKYERVSLTK